MADTTVNLLTALGAAPATDDDIPIWDTSAGAYKRVTAANLLGGTMTGNGVLATAGFTLTVPATGTAALLGTSNDFTARSILSGGVRAGVTGTMADDSAVSVTPPATAGLMIIYGTFLGTSSRRNTQAMIVFDISNNALTLAQQSSTEVEVTTGALTGTTGTDGVFTVSVHTDGKIYFENRQGVTINEGYLFLT